MARACRPAPPFAFSPNGTLYADDEPYAIFDAHQQLWSVGNGHANLL